MNIPVDPRSLTVARAGLAELKHLPGPRPSLSRTLTTARFMAKPMESVKRLVDAYGHVYRREDYLGWSVSLIGADANELVLLNRDRVFSSKIGWDPLLGLLFPNGLMMMDFDEHRLHRKALSVAFTPKPMRSYFDGLKLGIKRAESRWPTSDSFHFYPTVKALTLDLAAGSFLGLEWGPEAQAINSAFTDMVMASTAPIRKPLPFTAMRRGVRGREFLCQYFAGEVPKRRGSDAADIFTQICNTDGPEGVPLSPQEIVDHISFLMMAAHDTLSSSIVSLTYRLGQNPEWQERLRAEVDAVRARHGDDLPLEALDELELLEMAFKEALRLLPPVPMLPRRAVKEFEFGGYRIPAGSTLAINPLYVHRMEEYWPEPERFDPMRFTPEVQATRHRFAWTPFGAGAHMCLGQHFATMQAKAFFFHLLAQRRIVLAPGYQGNFRPVPIPRPRDGLPLRLPRR